MLTAIRDVQIPLIALLMLGACTAKLAGTLRTWSVDDGLGPTALFPMRTRRPLAMVLCGVECGLGFGLILTAGRIGSGAPANCIRLGSGLMFLVATSALLELRATRPDVGCGCFGDFSTAPVSGRTLVRSALLSAAALSTVGLGPISLPRPGSDTARLLIIMMTELIVLAALSPELGEALVRLGYSEPCELRSLPADRTIAALRRSKQWRRQAGFITADVPTDIWRELCWRYVVFPARCGERRTEVVFAIFLKHRRPAIHAAMVDATTAEQVPWPAAPGRPVSPARRAMLRLRLAPGPGMPFSRDL